MLQVCPGTVFCKAAARLAGPQWLPRTKRTTLRHPAYSRKAIRRSAARVACYRETKESTASAGRDRESALDWTHVANEVKLHVAGVFGGDHERMLKLQSWLSETKLVISGESDLEHNQTEVLADLAAEVVGVDTATLNVQHWLSSPDIGPDVDPYEDEADSKMAGVLMLRLLQAYHQETGKEFDDEDGASYDKLHTIASQALDGSMDRELLNRLVRAFVSLPFGGLI